MKDEPKPRRRLVDALEHVALPSRKDLADARKSAPIGVTVPAISDMLKDAMHIVSMELGNLKAQAASDKGLSSYDAQKLRNLVASLGQAQAIRRETSEFDAEYADKSDDEIDEELAAVAAARRLTP